MSSLFLIPSLLAAGFAKTDATTPSLTGLNSPDGPASGTLFEIFKQQHEVTLADHRSHSSHSSHASHQSGSTGGGHYSHMSHTSHRSSTSGYDPSPSPAPLYTSPGPVTAPATMNATDVPTSGATLPSLGGRTKRFKAIVRRVQIALLAQGVYVGPLNGAVGPLTRAALRKFQAGRGLQPTGTITPETLDALKIASE